MDIGVPWHGNNTSSRMQCHQQRPPSPSPSPSPSPNHPQQHDQHHSPHCDRLQEEQVRCRDRPQQHRPVPILERPPSHMPPAEPNHPSGGVVDAMAVTPDEVLALGVLALAGLWPGSWCGIAAIMIGKVERLAQRGAVSVPFQRCAQSLVHMLLKRPADANLTVETWQELATAQARLPDDLGQVLGLACSLLQNRTMEAADVRARRKRRRASSSDTVFAIAAPPPMLTPPYATALVVMVTDVGHEGDLEKKRKREKQLQRLATASLPSTPPPSLQPPPPPPPSPTSPPPPLLPNEASPPPPQRTSPQQPEHVSPMAAVHPSQLPLHIPPYGPSILNPFLSSPTTVTENLNTGSGCGDASGEAAGADFPFLVPNSLSSLQKHVGDWGIVGGHHGLQGAHLPPPPLPPPPIPSPSLPHGAAYSLHLQGAQSAVEEGGAAVQPASLADEAVLEACPPIA